MKDHELLEAAAKAAGYRIEIEENWTLGELPYIHLLDENRRCWWPLRDDGDALRLAVELDIDIKQYRGTVICKWANPGEHYRHVSEPFEGDKFLATRRAIVRAAAKMGAEK